MRARTLLSAWMLVTAACTGGRVGGTCDARVEPGDDDHAAISAALAALSDGQTLCLTGGRFVLDAPLAIDVTRVARLRAAGYRAHTQLIPAAITPKNRLILAVPQAERR